MAAHAIPDFHDFRPEKAAREVITRGFTCLDDFSHQNEESALHELLDALGFAADEMEIVTDTFKTVFGPVRVFRNPGRATMEQGRAFVAKHVPMP